MIKEILKSNDFQVGVAVGITISLLGWVTNRVTGLFSIFTKWLVKRFFTRPDFTQLIKLRKKIKAEFELSLKRRSSND